MSKVPMQLTIGAIFLLSIVAVSWAKRGAPPEVKPLISDGVKYVARHEQVVQGRRPVAFRALVEARDASTGELRWTTQIYRINYTPEETDVQDEWIASLKMHEGRLIVTTEYGRRYEVDIRTGKLVKSKT